MILWHLIPYSEPAALPACEHGKCHQVLKEDQPEEQDPTTALDGMSQRSDVAWTWDAVLHSARFSVNTFFSSLVVCVCACAHAHACRHSFVIFLKLKEFLPAQHEPKGLSFPAENHLTPTLLAGCLYLGKIT